MRGDPPGHARGALVAPPAVLEARGALRRDRGREARRHGLPAARRAARDARVGPGRRDGALGGLAEAAGFEVYLCDPRSPWRRGANESADGLLRQLFPKGTDFSRVSDEDVARAQDPLNGRPRKTLGRRAPAEGLARILTEGGAVTE